MPLADYPCTYLILQTVKIQWLGNSVLQVYIALLRGIRVGSGWTETGQWQEFHTSDTKKAQVWPASLPGTE